jgi:hypothetical protein
MKREIFLPARHPRYVPPVKELAPKPPVAGSYYPSRHPNAKEAS